MKPHKPKHHESDTVILKRHPVLRAILDQCLDKLGHVITVAISAAMIAVVGSCNHFNQSHDTKWLGAHIADKQAQIDDLKTNKTKD